MSRTVNRLVPSVENAGNALSWAQYHACDHGFECYWRHLSEASCHWASQQAENASVALDMAVAAESDRRRGRAA